MKFSRRTLLFLLLAGLFGSPLTAFGQVNVWPSDLYKPPGDPSCFTVSVDGGAWIPVYLEVYAPWGGPDYWYLELDGNGQAYGCIDEGWAEGQYTITGVYYYGWWYSPAWTMFTVYPAPLPPPEIHSTGAGCDNWDCVWATGTRFQPDSRVIVYSANWAYSQTYYGPAWQTWPGLNVSADGQSLSFQVADSNLRQSFGWDGLYLYVLNNDGTASGWSWVRSPQPAISSAGPACADLYCIRLSGNFPQSAYVDFRVPGTSELLPDAYTDLVVTPSQITLRLNPGARYAYDTSGLNAWVVNPAVGNWSDAYYLGPVDRAITGWISGVSVQGQNAFVSGWACAKTHSGSIGIHMYVGGAAGGGGAMALAATANQPTGPDVAAACNSTGTNYGFSVQIPQWVMDQYPNQPIYIHGISPFGLPNLLLNASGNFTVPAIDRSITGWIDGVSPQGSEYYLYGWACAKTYAGSIDVHAYVGAAAGNGGVLAFSGTANVASEAGLQTSCNATGSNYRFWLHIPPSVIQQYGGQSIHVHGISPFGLPNLAIGNSGTFVVPGAPPGTLFWKKDYIKDAGGVPIADALPQPSDTTPPTAPGAVQCGNPTSSALTITWTQASDSGSGVAGYTIYRGVLPVGSLMSPATSFVDNALQPQTPYSYRVVALDYAMNASNFSNTADCQTQ
jgi:hypothetical protein